MTQPPPDLKVHSEYWPFRDVVELFVYQDGVLIGTAELDIKDTIFADPGDTLIQLLKVTRTEPFEEFNGLINGDSV